MAVRQEALQQDIAIEPELPRIERDGQPRTTALFIVPPFPARTYAGRTMGPDYIGANLRKSSADGSHDIKDWEILDLDIIDPDKREEVLIAKLQEKPYTLVGLSFLSFQADEAMEIAEIADKVLRERGDRETDGEGARHYTPIIVGGRGVTDAPSYAHLFPEVDFWAVGREFHQPIDATIKIAQLIKEGRVIDPEALRDILHIVYLDRTKDKVVYNMPNLLESETSALPERPLEWYFRGLERKVHHENYDFNIFEEVLNDGTTRKRKTAQVYTQTGCESSCSFCFESQRRAGKNNPIPHERSMQSVIKELYWLAKQDYEGIYFDDSTFTDNRPRALEIMKVMGKLNRRFGIVWGFNTRIDALDRELIETAIANGCVYEFEGVESLVPEVIEGVGKIRHIDNPYFPEVRNGEEYVRKTKEVFRMMRELGLTNAVFLIFGTPKAVKIGEGEGQKEQIVAASIDDDKRSIRESIWELEPDYLSFNIMRFIPDAAISTMPKYHNYRGGVMFTGGFYYSKWREQKGISVPTTDHPVYQAFESAGGRYPIPPHMTPEVCYELLAYMVKEVNTYFETTGRKITIVTDKEFEEKHLRRDERGYYHLAPFESITDEKN